MSNCREMKELPRRKKSTSSWRGATTQSYVSAPAPTALMSRMLPGLSAPLFLRREPGLYLWRRTTKPSGPALTTMVWDGDEWKTAFNTPSVTLWVSGYASQALVNDILRDLINDFVFVYLDDILIFSRSQLENQLFVKAEKCEFQVSCLVILSAPKTRPLSELQQCSCDPYLFLITLGPTSLWTLSPVSHHQSVTLSSLLLFSGSLKLPTSFHYLNCLLPKINDA